MWLLEAAVWEDGRFFFCEKICLFQKVAYLCRVGMLITAFVSNCTIQELKIDVKAFCRESGKSRHELHHTGIKTDGSRSRRQKDETAALLSGCASSQKEVYRKMSLFFLCPDEIFFRGFCARKSL
ncbi:hypothetical protein HQ40_02090 [Porphyromonas gulae]|nr:hypothetical protein HQ40_02090 [Porphyromonas gulae]